MKICTQALLLAVGITAAGIAYGDDPLRVPGLKQFGIAPAPSSLVDDKHRPDKKAKPLEMVIDTIRHRLPGRALDARLIQWKGHEAYEIRWMGENGEVRDITADAASGKILDER